MGTVPMARTLPNDGYGLWDQFFAIPKIIEKSIHRKTTFWGVFGDFQDLPTRFFSKLGPFGVPVGPFFR